jgi:hypothetical protein
LFYNEQLHHVALFDGQASACHRHHVHRLFAGLAPGDAQHAPDRRDVAIVAATGDEWTDVPSGTAATGAMNALGNRFSGSSTSRRMMISAGRESSRPSLAT